MQFVRNFQNISAFEFFNDMRRLSAPLAKIGIDGFSYMEIKQRKWARYLDTDELFFELMAENIQSFLGGDPFINSLTDKSGTYFLDSLYRLNPSHISGSFFELCSIATGVAYIEMEGDCKKVFMFMTDKVVEFHANWFMLNGLLRRFVEHFKREAKDLIKKTNYYLIPRSCLDANQRLAYPSLLLADSVESFLADISEPQHPFERIAEDYQLTKRERECLSYLLKGYSARKVAAQMTISTRTAEEYIQNVRQKTQSPTIKDLLIKLATISRS